MIPFPNKKYNIIYADPPWSYSSKQDQHNNKPIHYSTMSFEEIGKLPIQKIADKNCALFLWTTPALLPEILGTVKLWQFRYVTKAFCWVKRNKKSNSLFWGQGYYTRSNSEDCYLFIKGRIKRISASVHQVLYSPIQEHSKKPDEIRTRIVQLFGDLPRIELFARSHTDGWDVWGDQIT